jgi:hypothetical protein
VACAAEQAGTQTPKRGARASISSEGLEPRVDEVASAPPGIATQVFNSGVLELGYVRRLASFGPLNVGLGAMGSVYLLDAGLRPITATSNFLLPG